MPCRPTLHPPHPFARLAVLSLGVALLAGPAGAAPEPDAQFCAVQCEGPGPADACWVFVLDGGPFSSPIAGGPPGFPLVARRGDLFVLPDGSGVGMAGEIALPTGAGDLVLAEADLEIAYSTSPPAGCERGFDLVHGTSRLPVPAVGLLEGVGVEVVQQPMAQIGLELGANLRPVDEDDPCLDLGTCLEAPIPRDERHYLFFRMEAGYEFKVGLLDLKSPGATGTLLFDPADPYFYIDAEAFEIPGIGNFKSGLGVSLHSEIPFVPISTWGMEDFIKPFTGTLYLSDKYAPFPKLPISAIGTRIYSIDPDQDGDSPFENVDRYLVDQDLEYAINGEFDVVWYPFDRKGKRGKEPKPKKVEKQGKKAKKRDGLNKLLRVKLSLGKASAGVRIEPRPSTPGIPTARAYLSGELEAGLQQLVPDVVPLPITLDGTARAALLLSENNLEESFARIEGEFALDTSVLAKALKLKALSVVHATNGVFSIDRHGFLLRGTSGSRVHPDIAPEQQAGVEAFIAPNGIDSHLALIGDVSIGGTYLHDAALVLSPKEFSVRGIWETGSSQYELEGAAGPKGVRLTGGAKLEIPYSREDTKATVKLLRKIAEAEKETGLLEDALEKERRKLAKSEAEATAVAGDLAAARAAVQGLDDDIAWVDSQLDFLRNEFATEQGRTCSVSYEGCRTCSSCGSCPGCGTCGKYDFACQARKAACELSRLDCLAALGICQAGRQICLGEREVCGVANQAGCELARAARITELGVSIGAKETERASLVAAREVALAALAPVIAANEAARRVLEAAQVAVEAAQVTHANALAGLQLLEQRLDELPDIEGTVDADLRLVLTDRGMGGEVEGRFRRRRILKGTVDFDADPPVACLDVPKATAPACVPL